MAAFDWYQATIPAAVDDVLEGCFDLGQSIALRHGRGIQGYATATQVLDDGAVIGRVMHGGIHAYPNALFTSDAAAPGSDLIRARWPSHTVTRVDVREDFAQEGAFDRMLPVLLDAATRHRVRVDTRGDHLLRLDARTVYLGAASSAVRVRQYDKAAELRAKFARDPERLADVPPHLTRVEAQVRPQDRESKAAFASIEPTAVMGSSAWLRDVWEGIGGLKLDPVRVTKVWRQPDDERAYAAMLFSYGALLQRMAADQGWECLGLQIRDDMARRAEAKKLRKVAPGNRG